MMTQPNNEAMSAYKQEVMDIIRKYHKEKDLPKAKDLEAPLEVPGVSLSGKTRNCNVKFTEEEIKELIAAHQNGNPYAYDYAFQLLVPYITTLYKPDKMPKGYEYGDYINASYYIVKDSADRFKPKKGADGKEIKFATFIAPKFNSPYIYNEIEPNQFGMTIMSRVKGMSRFIEKFEDENGRRPTDKEVSQALGIKEKTVKEYTHYDSFGTVSIFKDEEDDNNGDGGYMMEIEDKNAKVEETDDVVSTLWKKVQDLTYIQSRIIMLYFGKELIPGVERFRDGYRAADVCEYLGIKPSKFKKEYKEALNKLRISCADIACADLT